MSAPYAEIGLDLSRKGNEGGWTISSKENGVRIEMERIVKTMLTNEAKMISSNNLPGGGFGVRLSLVSGER
jgi:hypothetical protein